MQLMNDSEVLLVVQWKIFLGWLSIFLSLRMGKYTNYLENQVKKIKKFKYGEKRSLEKEFDYLKVSLGEVYKENALSATKVFSYSIERRRIFQGLC